MPNELPLKDVKICDFMWVMAGPASTRILADYGATVVRIESPTRVDTARTLQPYHGNQFGPDASGLFANCNAGKFGISLDLGNPASRAGGARSCPMGRRRHRVLLPQGDARVGLRLRIAAQVQSRASSC